MADSNNQDWAVQLPNQFPQVGQVLQSMIGAKERKQERADMLSERQQKRSESLAERQRQFNERQADRDLANQYKNAALIAEGTDISKYLTGDAVANDIATKNIASLLPKFTAMAKSGANPVDLQMEMQRATNQIVPALSNIKRELTLGDDAVKKLSELYPELDKEALIQKFREDVHQRTIDPQTGQLKPAQLIEPSQFQQNLTNPDFLSTFVRGNKNLVESITNPKGADPLSVLAGSPDSYVKYESKVPFWKKPSYAPEQISSGFLPKDVVPKLQIKSSVLPMDKISESVSGNKPFNIVDKDVYDRFEQDPKTNLELIASARKEYPQYDKFNPTEKEYIKRHILYNHIAALDQNDLHPTQSTKPSKVSVNMNTKEPIEVKDIYAEISDAAKGRGLKNAYPISGLNKTAKEAVLSAARNAYGRVEEQDAEGKTKSRELSQGDVALAEINGRPAVIGLSKGDVISYLDDFSVNTKANRGVKAQQKIIKASNANKTPKVTATVVKKLQGALD